jgi:hypothetical protein
MVLCVTLTNKPRSAKLDRQDLSETIDMIPELTDSEQKLARKFPHTFHAWKEMWAKTTDPSHPEYPEEGGRGIQVCDQWKSFRQFLKDMGSSPDDAQG